MLSYNKSSRSVINPQITRDSKVHDFLSYSLTESSGIPMGLRAFSINQEILLLQFVARLAQGYVRIVSPARSASFRGPSPNLDPCPSQCSKIAEEH